MTNPLPDAKQIAEWIGGGGQQAYVEDHEVGPAVFLVGPRGEAVVLHLGPRYEGVHPSDAFGDLISRVGKMYPWAFIGTVSEAWVKEADYDDRGNYPRGRMQELAEAGDTSVRTAVLASVFNLRDPLNSHLRNATVIREDPLEWTVEDLPGPISGFIATAVLGGYEHALAPPAGLGLPPLAIIAELITASGLASTAMVLGVE